MVQLESDPLPRVCTLYRSRGKRPHRASQPQLFLGIATRGHLVAPYFKSWLDVVRIPEILPAFSRGDRGVLGRGGQMLK